MGAMQGKVWIFDGRPEADPFRAAGNWDEERNVWARHVEGSRWHVVRVDNMDEACGRDNDGHPKYAADLAEVDVSSSRLAEALESCGFDDDGCDDFGNALPDLAKALAMHGYGAVAPLWKDAGESARDLARAGRRESRRLDAPEAYAAAMARPVNGLGQSAAEYQSGEMGPALERGAANGNPAARIMARCYVASEGRTLGGHASEETMRAARAVVSKGGEV